MHRNASNSQQAAQALRATLANPYQYSSHYAQAFQSQHASGSQLRTAEGYSYSPTYAASLQAQSYPSSVPTASHHGAHVPHRPSGGGNRGFAQRDRRPHQQETHWFVPGNHRCTYDGCAFTASKKSVEIHMMDRHLIFPPGWDKRKRKREWDADPSLMNSGYIIQLFSAS